MADQQDRGETEPRTSESSAAAEPRARTGAEQQWDPEDLAKAEGEDPTPENIRRRARQLDEEGASAIEKTVP